MSRLPVVGSDTDAWGAILNDYLGQEHTTLGGHSAITATGLTMTQSAAHVTFPDPQLNSNMILWDGTFAPQILGNSAGTGLTMACTGTEFVMSILRRDIIAGAQTVGDINFEIPNANGIAYRVGIIRGKQTINTAGSEQGYINIEAMNAGSNTEWARFGADAGGGLGVWAVTGLGSNQFLAINGAVSVALFNNGATGFLGTLSNHAMKLRQNNTDVITLTTPGDITLHGYGSGTGAVTVGAADSGGLGFKVLRVPN